MTPEKNLALLPNGFTDLLPPDAEQEAQAIHTLMQHFALFGYRRVKPPLAEFEDSLFAPGPGAALSDQSFRLMDPVSHKMLAVRSDITAQIARIASSRMAKEPRPLRLTYANDVLRTKSSQDRIERQFTKVGCEIIGPDTTEADIEMCVIALSGLQGLGYNDLVLDLSLPTLVDALVNDFNVPENARNALSDALFNRDVTNARALGEKQGSIFEGLIHAAGPADKALKTLKALDMPERARQKIEKLEDVYKALHTALSDMGIEKPVFTIDPLEIQTPNYYHGVSFTILSPHIRGELGRGGRYKIIRGGQQTESATGFSLYMDTVRKGMALPEKKSIVYVPVDVPWSIIRDLHEKGWTTMRGTLHDTAGLKSQCTHVYRDGEIKEA